MIIPDFPTPMDSSPDDDPEAQAQMRAEIALDEAEGWLKNNVPREAGKLKDTLDAIAGKYTAAGFPRHAEAAKTLAETVDMLAEVCATWPGSHQVWDSEAMNGIHEAASGMVAATHRLKRPAPALHIHALADSERAMFTAK